MYELDHEYGREISYLRKVRARVGRSVANGRDSITVSNSEYNFMANMIGVNLTSEDKLILENRFATKIIHAAMDISANKAKTREFNNKTIRDIIE